ncbi:MAG TPA: copper transporter [Pilimelia sp.]|nr:copper transporter [Pilimelia sp.]
MINFRYHVVSLTAVFLALAIGLVVGTAALNGPLLDAINDEVNSLRGNNSQLREQVNHLKDEVNREEEFITAAAPRVLHRSLANRRVLLLTLPGGRDHAEGVAGMLTTAGARITARVDVEDKFTDPRNGVELLDLSDHALPASVSGGSIPANSDGVETASALLAAVLLDRTPTVTEADRRAVVAAYDAAGYLNVDDRVTGPAELAVIVAGLPYTDREATEKNKAVVTLTDQFDKAGAVVVAGVGVAGTGNVVSVVRGDPALSKTVSTVDNAGTAQGQLVTALAAAEQLAGRIGQYGLGGGAQAMLPTLAP